MNRIRLCCKYDLIIKKYQYIFKIIINFSQNIVSINIEFYYIFGWFLSDIFILFGSLSPKNLQIKNTKNTNRKCLYDYVLNYLGPILLSANKKDDLIPHQYRPNERGT
jgi:hypothetical protein